MEKRYNTTESLAMYCAVVYCTGILLLSFLNPTAIPDWMITGMLVMPTFFLFNRGRIGLGVLVLGLGLTVAALITKYFLHTTH